jgi:hypothetical protein
MPATPAEYRLTTDKLMHCPTCGQLFLIVECGLLCEHGCGRILELPDWIEVHLLKAAWPEQVMFYREPPTRKAKREDTEPLFDLTAHFNGSDYDPSLDDPRLKAQILRVFDLMRDREWRTLSEISEATSDPPASVSAQLRHLRKARFGAYAVNKRSRGHRESGLFEYQLDPTPGSSGRMEAAL